jgi:hypothetical protein
MAATWWAPAGSGPLFDPAPPALIPRSVGFRRFHAQPHSRPYRGAARARGGSWPALDEHR